MKTFPFLVSVHLDIQSDNKRLAESTARQAAKSFRNFNMRTLSAVFGVAGTTATGTSVSHYASREDLKEQEIRVIGLLDIQNILDTKAFMEHDSPVLNLLDVLLDNAESSESAYLPDYFRKSLWPLSSVVWKSINDAETKHEQEGTPFDYRERFSAALESVSDKNFAVFVKVETPVRRYFPDGDYEASWGHTRALYGHGHSYEAALHNAYSMIKRMRKEKLL